MLNGGRVGRRIFAVSAAFQLLVVAVSSRYVRTPFFPDAQLYDRLGRTIAELWHTGPAFSTGQLAHITATNTWGTQAFFGAVYYVFGEHWLYAKLALALIAATGPVAIYVLAARIVSSRRALQMVVIAAVLYPTAAFWSAVGLKDAAVGALAFDVLALQVALPSPWGTFVGVAGAAALLPVRPVLSGTLVLAFLFSRGAGERSATRVVRVVVAGAVIALTVLPTAQRLAGDTTSVSAGAGGAHYVIGNEGAVQVEGGLVAQLTSALNPAHIVQGILTPRPWDFSRNTATPYRWMYLGTALWIGLLPSIVIGAAIALRRGRGPSRALLLFAGSYAFFYYVTYRDGFARQRTPLEMIGLIFAGLAFSEQREVVERLTSLWVCAIVVIGITQAEPATGAVAALAFGGVWLVVARRNREARLARSVVPGGPGRDPAGLPGSS